MRLRRILLVIGIGVVALIAFVVSGTGTGVDARTHAGLSANGAADVANASAHLEESIVRVEHDGETRFPIHLSNTAEATLVVGGSDALNITITMTDANGDGVIPLEFQAGPVGPNAVHLWAVDGGDDYESVALGPDDAIPAGEYDLDVYAGDGVSGEPSDVGTLVIAAPSEPPEATIEGAPVTLAPQDGQTISGTSELDADRNVTVRLRSSGENPFLLSNQVSVGEGGDFSATFDLSDVRAPTNATATVTVDGETIAEAQVAVEAARTQTETGGQPGFGVGIAMVALAGLAIGLSGRD